MLFSALLALLPLAPLAAAAPVDLAKRQSYGGRATFYDVGLGACGGYNVASDFIVALNAPQYGGGYPGPNCGRSLTISYGGKSATAVVRDLCPGCGYGDLDMSRGLFNYFASESMGVFQMSWHWNDGNSQPQPAPAPAPAPSPSPAPPPPPPPAPSPSPSPEPQWTPAPAPSPSTTQAPAPAPAPSSSSAAPVIAVAVQSSAESSSASAASSVSSASGSASASVSAPASSASAVAPGSAQVLAAQDNNIAAIASAVINLGRIAVVGANGTDAA